MYSYLTNKLPRVVHNYPVSVAPQGVLECYVCIQLCIVEFSDATLGTLYSHDHLSDHGVLLHRIN